jgi:hypothetical protein
MAEAIPSVNQHLEHCAYLRDTQNDPHAPQKSCESRPIASLDNVCLATYVAEGDAANRSRATIEVDCRHHGRGLRSEIDLPEPQFPVALRWSKSRELEILIDKPGVRITSAGRSNSAQRFRVASRQATDPPVLECLPVSRDHPTLAEHLPMAITVGAWRAYRRPGVCLMTARIPKEEVPGADGDTLLQFRRMKHATLPFATSRLAFVVQTYQTYNPRPLLVDLGEHRLAMIQHPQEMNHIISGKVAETLLKNLQQNPAEVRVTPEGAPSYTIPIRRQDFDFAYSDFSECLSTLKAS